MPTPRCVLGEGSGGYESLETPTLGGNFDRETTLTEGAWSQNADFATHTSAGVQKQCQEYDQFGGMDASNAVNKLSIRSNMYISDLSFDNEIAIGALVYSGWDLAAPTFWKIEADGSITLHSQLGGTQYAQSAAGVLAVGYNSILVAVEVDGVNVRVRVWTSAVPPGDFSTWGSPVIDYSRACTTGQPQKWTWLSGHYGGGAAPAVVHGWDSRQTETWTDDTDLLSWAPPRVTAVGPSGLGTDSQFTQGAGASPHPDVTNVDGFPTAPNDSTDWDGLSSISLSKNQTYAMTDFGALPAGAVMTSVVPQVWTKIAAGASATVRYYINGAATNGSVVINADATYRGGALRIDASALSLTDVNTIEVGMRRISGSSTHTVELSEVWLSLCYYVPHKPRVQAHLP